MRATRAHPIFPWADREKAAGVNPRESALSQVVLGLRNSSKMNLGHVDHRKLYSLLLEVRSELPEQTLIGQVRRKTSERKQADRTGLLRVKHAPGLTRLESDPDR